MNINEFRKNMKASFDEALKGNAVLIERGGVPYKLVADVVVFKKPTDTVTTYSIPITPAKEKTPKSVALSAKTIIPSYTTHINDSCPHGYAKGLCKKADCNRKYA